MLWYSSMASSLPGAITVLGLVGGAPRGSTPPRVGEIPRAPDGGARPVPGLHTGYNRPRKSSQVRADLRGGRCAGLQRLARSVALGQPGGRVKRSRTTNQRLRQVRTNHLQPGSTAGKRIKQHSQTAQQPLTTTSHERRRDRGGSAAAPEEVHLQLPYEPPWRLCAAEECRGRRARAPPASREPLTRQR